MNLELRRKIAQLFIDMNVGDSRPVKKQEMIPMLKEINNTAIIGHAMRFVTNTDGRVTELKKYRKTAIEKRVEK